MLWGWKDILNYPNSAIFLNNIILININEGDRTQQIINKDGGEKTKYV